MTKLLTHAEAKARLRVGKNAVYELAKNREFPVTKIGGRLFFPEDGIEAYIQKVTRPAKRNFLGPHRHHFNRGAV